MNPETRFRKSTLSSAVLLALGIQGAALTLPGGAARADLQACTDQDASQLTTDLTADGTPIFANFTMLDSGGAIVGGTNDVAVAWDGTVYTASTDYTGPGSVTNMTLSSSWPFFNYTWTAHDIQVFAPGSYSFDVTLGGGAAETSALNVTVPAGKLGIHMLFDWASTSNIDVFVVVDQNSVFGSGVGTKVVGSPCTSTTLNCLWTGKGWVGGLAANAPAGSAVWMLTSIDGNADGFMGISMPSGGPFGGFNANFNFNFATAPTFTSGTVCNPSDDVQPNPFDFTDVSGVAGGSVNTSNSITVSGLTDLDGGGVVSPISVTGGTYSVNGGGYTNASGTVTNGDTVTVRQTASANEDGTTTDTVLSIGGVPGTYSVTTIDQKPDAPVFTDQTGVAVSTPVESNAQTIAGMDAGESAPISIAGGTYSINGGAPTAVAGTVVNGDVVRVQQTSSAVEATTTIATLTLGSALDGTLVSATFTVSTAGGVESTGNNFTMLNPVGGVVGGTNDVAFFWDQQYNTDENDAVTAASAHMRISSNTAFFQFNWVAHHIRVFEPGTYTIDTTCTTTQLEAGTAACNNLPLPQGQTQQFYTFTVGAGQIGAHMLFDWGKDDATKPCGKANCNIDVVDIWDQDAIFSPSPMYTGAAGFNAASTVWNLMSGDWDGDGQNGAAMIDGPFMGFKANFNLNFTGTLAPTDYTPTVNVGDPSGAKGCSISTKPVSVLARGDWWLVAGFLTWLGAIRLRFKRQAKS